MTATNLPISVIIPSYNCAGYLPGAVESALGQTLSPAEIIVVDDGSRDETEEVAKRLVSLSPSVRYVRQANAGVSAARNTGVGLATGTWIALLDADDRWHPRKLELQAAAIHGYPEAAWSLTGCEVIDAADRTLDGDPFLNTFSIFRQLGQSPDAFFRQWLNPAQSLDAGDREIPLFRGDLFEPLFLGNVCLPSSAIVRRDALEAAGGFNSALRLAEETEFFHRLAARWPVAYLAGPLVRYRKGGEGSLTAKTNTVPLTRNALESMRAAVEYRRGLTTRERETYGRGRTNLLLYMARAQIAESDPRGARETLRTLRTEGKAPASRLIPLQVLAMLPGAALRTLQSMRRALRG